MSASLAREKELLLVRCALCRLRLGQQSSALRDSLRWRPMAIAAAASPGAWGALLEIALSLPVLARAARFTASAVRIVILARLAVSLIGHARALAGAAPATRSVR
jgi:hypothetical protein